MSVTGARVPLMREKVTRAILGVSEKHYFASFTQIWSSSASEAVRRQGRLEQVDPWADIVWQGT